MAHYVQNLGDEPLFFLELFRNPRFADFSLNQWMTLTPARLIEAHLNLDPATIAALRRDKPILVKSSGRQMARRPLGGNAARRRRGLGWRSLFRSSAHTMH